MDLPLDVRERVCALLPIADRIRAATACSSLRDDLLAWNLLPAGPCSERVRDMYSVPRIACC